MPLIIRVHGGNKILAKEFQVYLKFIICVLQNIPDKFPIYP